MEMPQTAPVVMTPFARPKMMWAVNPSPHTPKNPTGKPGVPAPEPASDDVSISVIESLQVAVIKFSGYAVPDVVTAQREQLKSLLAAAGVPLAADADEQLMLAQYNEFFSLPWNRDNEVWLKTELKTELL